MTYTSAHYAAALAAASASVRDSARDGGLAAFLMIEQSGVCFDCGIAPAVEFAHFVRANGRTDANMTPLGAMACRRCNLKHDRVCDALGTDGTLPYAYLAANGRADRIPTVYPTRSECVRLHRQTLATWEADLAAEVAAEVANLG